MLRRATPNIFTPLSPGPHGNGTRNVHPLQPKHCKHHLVLELDLDYLCMQLALYRISAFHVRSSYRPPRRFTSLPKKGRAGLFSTGASIACPASAPAFIAKPPSAVTWTWQFLPPKPDITDWPQLLPQTIIRGTHCPSITPRHVC